jgi:hypothetical protein
VTAPFALSAVTATLRGIIGEELLREGLPNTVTARPLDRVSLAGTNGSHVNLFLYHVALSGAWRNTVPPAYAKGGETPWPPLALDLYYLLTAFAGNNEDTPHPLSQRLLGCSMRALHDHPLVDADRLVREDYDNNNYRHTQVEHLRITHQPMSLEEMSKLWTTFQTHYRLSVAYMVSVVLIESSRPSVTPLPVLSRGVGDRGVAVQADMGPPLPTLEAIRTGTAYEMARLGDRIELVGRRLEGDAVIVRFEHPLTGATIEHPPDAIPPASASSVTVTLPNDAATAAAFPPGMYMVGVVVTRATDAGSPRRSNLLPLALAPRLVIADPLPIVDGVDDEGNPTRHISLGCIPHVWPTQRAVLLLGGNEFPAEPRAAPTGTLEVDVSGVPAGTYFARIRVDGVDSFLVDRTKTPPEFDPSQSITLP